MYQSKHSMSDCNNTSFHARAEKAKSRNAKIRRYFGGISRINALRNSARRRISSQPIKNFASAISFDSAITFAMHAYTRAQIVDFRGFLVQNKSGSKNIQPTNQCATFHLSASPQVAGSESCKHFYSEGL